MDLHRIGTQLPQPLDHCIGIQLNGGLNDQPEGAGPRATAAAVATVVEDAAA
jgi:hypothetical protein